jgi:hypothetical protein
MKKLVLTIAVGLTMLTLTACPDSNKGDSSNKNFLTSPNSCINYQYNAQLGYYVTPQGQRVNCNPGMYGQTGGGYYGAPLYGQGCEGWSYYYPGTAYVPINYGSQIMCVRVDYLQTVPGYNNYYSLYGSYPSYAQSCQYPYCPTSCLSGGGGYQNDGYWLGGTLALCW